MAKKKIHAADAATLAMISKAVSFNCHLRLSPSAKINEPAKTLAEAARKADQIRAKHPGRNVLVYAIMPEGHIPADVPVPADMVTAARKPDFVEAKPAKAQPAKPAKAVKPAPAKPEKAEAKAQLSKRAALIEAAQRGELPAAPDFSAPTHARFRKKLDAVADLVVAGDIDGLKAFPINPVSSSPKAIAKYRDLAVMALEARRKH